MRSTASARRRIFRGAGAFLLLAPFVAAHVHAGAFADVDVQAGTDDNVSRSENRDDIEDDRFAQASVRVGEALQIGSGTSLALSGSVRAIEFRRFRNLGEVAGGAAVSLRHKFGLGPEAPWLSLLADGEFIDSDSFIRDGERYGVGVRAGRRIGDRWSIAATVRHEWREADEDDQRLPPNRPTFPGVVASTRGDVFEFDATELALTADYQFDNAWLLLMSYSLRDGDVVSTARPNATIVGAAKAITSDAAVYGPGRSAYRIGALTHTALLGLNYPLAETVSVELDYEYQRSDAVAGIAYDKNLLRLRLLWAY